MDIAISQHFLQPILSFFSGVIKMLVEIQMENCDQDHLDRQEEKVGIFFSQLLFIIIRTESTQLTG